MSKFGVLIAIKKTLVHFISLLLVVSMVSACARDLSDNVYISNETMNLVLDGKVISSRQVVIKESDKLGDNTTGIVGGGIVGGALAGIPAHNAGNNSGAALLIVGGVLAGAVVGALVESGLSKADGTEYIIKVDGSKIADGYYEGSMLMRSAISAARTTGLLSIVQQNQATIKDGQKVHIVLSSKRARIIPVK